jgi:hypothetical protein
MNRECLGCWEEFEKDKLHVIPSYVDDGPNYCADCIRKCNKDTYIDSVDDYATCKGCGVRYVVVSGCNMVKCSICKTTNIASSSAYEPWNGESEQLLRESIFWFVFHIALLAKWHAYSGGLMPFNYVTLGCHMTAIFLYVRRRNRVSLDELAIATMRFRTAKTKWRQFLLRQVEFVGVIAFIYYNEQLPHMALNILNVGCTAEGMHNLRNTSVLLYYHKLNCSNRRFPRALVF